MRASFQAIEAVDPQKRAYEVCTLLQRTLCLGPGHEAGRLGASPQILGWSSSAVDSSCMIPV